VGDWSFLTNHARAMLFIANRPDARLRDIASALNVTERTAHGIVVDLTEGGYVVKERDGRRNRYHIQEHLPLRDTISRGRAIGRPGRRSSRPSGARLQRPGGSQDSSQRSLSSLPACRDPLAHMLVRMSS
jgi:hypothetical protein